VKKLLLLPLLWLAGCAVFHQESIYTKTLASTVRLESSEVVGSGVILNAHCILTAGHMVSDPQLTEPPHIFTQYKHEYVIDKIIPGPENMDVAVACVKETFSEPPVTLDTAMPDRFDPIFVLGQPLGISDVMTQGNYQGDGNITAPIIWGNSGGGAFDMRGHLIGIVVNVHVKQIGTYVFVFPHLGYIEQATNILKFLNANHITYTV
jgi:S1-C subfamily serine protease